MTDNRNPKPKSDRLLSDAHMEALEEAGTREAVLALDNDDAGKKGAAKIAERLKKKGIGSRRIFPPCKDWNEYLVSGGLSIEEKKAYVRGLVQDASLMRPSPPGLRSALEMAVTWQAQMS